MAQEHRTIRHELKHEKSGLTNDDQYSLKDRDREHVVNSCTHIGGTELER